MFLMQPLRTSVQYSFQGPPLLQSPCVKFRSQPAASDLTAQGQTPVDNYIQGAEMLDYPWLRNDAGVLLHLKGLTEAGIRGSGSFGFIQELGMRIRPHLVQERIAAHRPDSLTESLKWFLLVMADDTAASEQQAKAGRYAQELLAWLPLDMVTAAIERYETKRKEEGKTTEPAESYKQWYRGYQQRLAKG